METAYEVVHSLPGRMRVRLKQIHRQPGLAAGLEHLLLKESGVRSARANAGAASVTIEFNPNEFVPLRWFDQLRLDQMPTDIERAKSNGQGNISKLLFKLRRQTFVFEARFPPTTQFALSVLSLAATWVEAPALIMRPLLIASILPILNRGVQTLFEEKRLSNDGMDAASCFILLAHESFRPAAIMTCLLSLGEMIRYETTQACQRLFAHQLDLGENSAWLIKGHRRIRIPVRELKQGDHIVVYPGELVPLIGTVYGGEGTVVPATPEMDFEPRKVQTGDFVNPDLLLTEGKLYVRNEQGEICLLSDPVHEKQTRRWLQRTRLHKRALHFGHKGVLPMVSVATLLYVLTRDVHRALALVTFDFITGVKIAIPTAVLSSMYKAGSRGIVIRNAMAMEKLAEVNAIIYARGGALTALKPEVTDIFVCEGYEMEQVTRLAASVVQRYNHLGASSIISYAHLNKIPVPERTESNVIENGIGVSAKVEDHAILVGSSKLIREQGVDLSPAKEFLEKTKVRGDTRACVVIDGKLAGVIAYQDPMREEAPEVVASLKRMGIKEFAIVTSGGEVAARKVAERAGISNVHSRAMPEDQAAIVRDYKKRGLRVAVVGHDAANTLALEQADVAVSLESGADIARHRADVVLTSNSLTGLVEGIEIARDGMQLARNNLYITTASNVSGLVLTVFDRSDVLAATLINNGSVIAAAANGMRPLLDRPQEDGDVDEPLDY